MISAVGVSMANFSYACSSWHHVSADGAWMEIHLLSLLWTFWHGDHYFIDFAVIDFVSRNTWTHG